MVNKDIRILKSFNRFLLSTKKRINVLYGGAGSGKSKSVARHLIRKLITEEDKRILLTRHTFPSIRISSWYDVLVAVREIDLPVKVNRSDLSLSFRGNELISKSLDDPEKIKSAEFNYIWVEEPTEISHEDFLQLNLRLRRATKEGEINQMFLTFNPIDQFHWLITDLVQGTREDVAVHHSTHKDNRFLSEVEHQQIENLIHEDMNYYRIYALGEPGRLENVIYSNYEVVKELPKKFDDVWYGLDFGFNNPTALIKLAIHDKNLYVIESLYKSYLTNADLIQFLKSAGIKEVIYADSSEPQRINEIRRAGFDIHPANKSVKDGLDAVKRHRLRIYYESPNIIGEIRGYCYRKDKEGKPIPEEPVKFKDHAMDAMRYGVASHLPGFGTVAPRQFGVVSGRRKW